MLAFIKLKFRSTITSTCIHALMPPPPHTHIIITNHSPRELVHLKVYQVYRYKVTFRYPGRTSHKLEKHSLFVELKLKVTLYIL